MNFASFPFIIFFSLVILLLALTNLPYFKKLDTSKVSDLRHIILLISSYVFYGWWDWRFCFLMLFMTSVAYWSALKISKKPTMLIYRIIGIAVPLIVLGVFKYFNFFIDSFTGLFGISQVGSLKIILPVGISFYTFQSMSYTIDVIREKIQATKDFIKLNLYISFFPQLVAGPIVKAAQFLPQLDQNRNVSISNMAAGLQIFMFGLFKKIVIADYLSVFVDEVFAIPEAFGGITVLLAVVSYSIQIYFDFSGYSDMAVGCARCMGYEIPRNFNLPYIAQNVSDFWKRWHISLSSWLKEYLYIPLGGNRKGKVRTFINLMLTMVLGGLWHGAAWTFVFWGFLHGIALSAHKFISKGREGIEKPLILKLLNILATYIFVSFCWIFFRAESFSLGFRIIRQLFVWNEGIVHIYSWSVFAIVLLIGATLIAVRRNSINKDKKEIPETINGFYPVLKLKHFWSMVLFIVVTGTIIGVAYTGANPFIYFQF